MSAFLKGVWAFFLSLFFTSARGSKRLQVQ